MLQKGLTDLKTSRADFHQPPWFNLNVISWPCFSRVVPKLERAAKATNPLHSHNSALKVLLVPIGGKESNPGPCFLLTGRASLQQREVHLTSSCGHILMSNTKRCTGHLRPWSTNPVQLSPVRHCCWYFRAGWPYLCRTAQVDLQKLSPRSLNTDCFYLYMHLLHESTITWMERGNAVTTWELSACKPTTCCQLSDRLSSTPEICRSTNIIGRWIKLAWGFVCHWICFVLHRGGKISHAHSYYSKKCFLIAQRIQNEQWLHLMSQSGLLTID